MTQQELVGNILKYIYKLIFDFKKIISKPMNMILNIYGFKREY